MKKMKYPDGRKNADGSITSAYLQRQFKEARRMALNAPVPITVHGRRELILMTRDEFERMSGGSRAPELDLAQSDA